MSRMRYTDNTSLQQRIGQIARTGSILDLERSISKEAAQEERCCYMASKY
jgi:hypothetical protein